MASVGSTGDSYDNALAEAFNSLFKAELVRNKGPWKNIDDLEIAVAEYINHRRLHREIGIIPPAELEEMYYLRTPLWRGPKRQFRASGLGDWISAPRLLPTQLDDHGGVIGAALLALKA